ncbi:membrane protein insertase YidC [uncultured Amnibacterium sp.]|uniref:membrane protein insertase YidC n=1 Tax=uncultured Amnibacterium sp. TaxID=1631851 RepID=UPI0035CC448E
MDPISTVLWPFKWVIEAILVGFHFFWSDIVHLDPNAGLTWVLSVLGLVLVVRSALIPLFVRQIKSQRKMMEIAPQLKKIQEKYKGKRDQFSREAMSRETMELYRNTGTSPLSSCFPLLAQMPIFFSLFQVLNNAAHETTPHGVGLMNTALSLSFGSSSLFGAPLKSSIGTAGTGANPALVVTIAIIMIILMSASQFFTQLQIMAKNVSPETKASPMYKQQRVLLYILPFVFIFSGVAFPLGVMFYWVFSNVWTMGQQFIVIRNSPTPGSDAAKERDARLARRDQRRQERAALAAGEPPAAPQDATDSTPPVAVRRPTTQRVQPMSKNRAKRAGEGRA